MNICFFPAIGAMSQKLSGMTKQLGQLGGMSRKLSGMTQQLGQLGSISSQIGLLSQIVSKAAAPKPKDKGGETGQDGPATTDDCKPEEYCGATKSGEKLCFDFETQILAFTNKLVSNSDKNQVYSGSF